MHTEWRLRFRLRRRQLRSLWRNHRWWVVAALWLAAFILGSVGARERLRVASDKWTPLDPLYRALQLFVLEDSMPTSDVMFWPLEVARWLAPAVAAYTAVAAVAAIFSEKLQELKLRRYKNHIVVCGLGGNGAQLVKDFHNYGDRVVVIESNQTNPEIRNCREEGIVVLTGDAAHPALLGRARLHRAKCLIAICGDDGANVEIAAQAQQLLSEANSTAETAEGKRLPCLVHLTAPRLRTLVEKSRFRGRRVENALEVKFFNVFENSARALLNDYPPDRYADEQNPPHVLVVGFGHLGENVVLQAARTGHYASGIKLRITIIDQEAEKKESAFRRRFPMLNEAVVTHFRQMDIDGPEPSACNLFGDDEEKCEVTVAYICVDNDVGAVSRALTLLPGLRARVPVVVCMAGDGGLTHLIEDPEARGSHRVYAFRLNAAACRREIILGETQDILAKAIHAAYVSKQRSEGATSRDNPYLIDWESLPEEIRESNRQQADHIPVKLRAVGCEPEPVTPDNAAAFEFEREEIELLARMEHARWNAERFLAGWRYAPGVKDVERKTSPYLTSWENLSEQIKEYDRNTVRQLPKFLASAGLQICRLK